MFEIVEKEKMPPDLVKRLVDICFGASESADYYKFDFAYLFYGVDSKPVGFATCKELTKDDVWIDFGGTIPDQRGAVTIRETRDMFADLIKKYKTVSTQIHNKNFPMLKVYLHNKFSIVGTRLASDGRLFCELKKEIGA